MQDDQIAALQTLLLGTTPDMQHLISLDQIARWSSEFDFPEETPDVIATMLTFAANAYKAESLRSGADLAACREEFAKIEKAARKLVAALDATSPEASAVLAQARLARSVDVEKFDETMAVIGNQAMLRRLQAPLATDNDRELSKLRADIAELAAEMQEVQVFAGAERSGRPDDHAAFGLLHGIFQVWASVLGREFRLDWTKDGTPITDAARFCVAIARAVDPEISTARIMTAARKAREKGIQIKSLEELREVMEEYRKRFE